MKILIKDILRDVITEQLTWNKVSSIIGKLPSPVDASKYLMKIALGNKNNDLKKISLVFPKSGWETTAVNLMKSLGVVTGAYSSLNDAIRYCKTLVSKGVKADEFVIGSHGRPGVLLMTQEGTDYQFNTSFLNSFKSLISQNTIVFFTACHGANHLYTLKKASDALGVTTYASKGVYNYITNDSEKGFYWCTTKPIDESETDGPILPTYKGIDGFDKVGNIWLPNLNEPSGHHNAAKVDVTITIDPNVFGVNVNFSPIKLNLTSVDEEIINVENDSAHNFILDVNDVINKSKRHEIHKKGYDSERGINFDFIENIKSGKVKIEFTTKNGLINLTSLKPLQTKRKKWVRGNSYLLNNKICGKMSSSPITWVG